MFTYNEIDIYIDGAAKGNPGPAGAGVYITTHKDENDKKVPITIFQKSYSLGIQTNNVAEYLALLEALKVATKLGSKKVYVYSDSKLLVNQMNNQYQIRNPSLIKIRNIINRYISHFEKFTVTHIPRDQNRHADLLANMAIKKSTN